MKKILYYVTGNFSKFKRFSKCIPEDSGIELKQFDYNLIEEQTEDQLEIAISKAQQAWRQLGKPLIVDDVGVYFHKYNNFPGAFTKFVYKGLGFEGIYKLMNDGDEISILINVVYVYGQNQYKVFSVRKIGTFKKPLHSDHDKNAPFDLIFVPQGHDKSYVELEAHPQIYNEVYFRAIAMKQILEFIQQQL